MTRFGIIPSRAVPAGGQPVQDALDPRKLRRDVLPEVLVVAQVLGFDATDDSLTVPHQLVELFARADVELPEPLEEFHQVADRRVPKDLGLAAVLSLSVQRVLQTAECPVPFEGNTRQVLDSAIVQEMNYPSYEACYADELAAIRNYGRVGPAAELEVRQAITRLDLLAQAVILLV